MLHDQDRKYITVPFSARSHVMYFLQKYYDTMELNREEKCDVMLPW